MDSFAVIVFRPDDCAFREDGVSWLPPCPPRAGCSYKKVSICSKVPPGRQLFIILTHRLLSYDIVAVIKLIREVFIISNFLLSCLTRPPKMTTLIWRRTVMMLSIVFAAPGR